MRAPRPLIVTAFTFGLLLLGLSVVHATPFTATYTVAGAAGGQASEPVDSQPTGATLSDITRGPGINPNGGLNSINSNSWSPLGIDLTDYYELTITPDAGVEMDLTDLDFTERRSGSGIGAFEVRTSLDAFGSAIFTFDVPDTADNRRHEITLGAAFQGLLTPVTFRIFGYESEAPGGTWRLGIDANSIGSELPANLQLFGDLVEVQQQVPGPATAILLGVGLVGLAGAAWRRSRPQNG